MSPTVRISIVPAARSLRSALLPVAALAAALTLSACTGEQSPAERDAALAANAPAPAESLAADVEELVTTTDVGQYFITPGEGVTEEQIEGAIAKVRGMEGVQSVERREDGIIDLVFAGDPSAEAREAAVRQLAALGEVEEGV